jgi:hypothetical protein
MTASVARQIVLGARPKGRPQLTDFSLEETRVSPVCALIAQYNGSGPGDGTDRLPATMREIL